MTRSMGSHGAPTEAKSAISRQSGYYDPPESKDRRSNPNSQKSAMAGAKQTSSMVESTHAGSEVPATEVSRPITQAPKRPVAHHSARVGGRRSEMSSPKDRSTYKFSGSRLSDAAESAYSYGKSERPPPPPSTYHHRSDYGPRTAAEYPPLNPDFDRARRGESEQKKRPRRYSDPMSLANVARYTGGGGGGDRGYHRSAGGPSAEAPPAHSDYHSEARGAPSRYAYSLGYYGRNERPPQFQYWQSAPAHWSGPTKSEYSYHPSSYRDWYGGRSNQYYSSYYPSRAYDSYSRSGGLSRYARSGGYSSHWDRYSNSPYRQSAYKGYYSSGGYSGYDPTRSGGGSYQRSWGGGYGAPKSYKNSSGPGSYTGGHAYSERGPRSSYGDYYARSGATRSWGAR